MAKSEKITCDKCGRIKGEVNRWFKANIFLIPPELKLSFALHPCGSEPEGIEFQDVCGAECAHKLLDEFLQKAQSQ